MTLSAYFIREDGPFTGSFLSFEEGVEWILGRDPTVCSIVLEDPMVSRKHARLFTQDGHFFLENLSAVNPIHINGQPVITALQLFEQDSVQIGNNFFRFTEFKPDEEQEIESAAPAAVREEFAPFVAEEAAQWMIKVVTGPNQGAEFGMNPGETHILGKDPTVADIVFQDLSVSREHAKIHINENNEATITDLHSRNGTLVNGVKTDGITEIHSQDLLSMGTTSFLLIDRAFAQETIFSPTHAPLSELPEKAAVTEAPVVVEKMPTNWKETFIPTKHLILASVFSLLLCVGVVSLLSLFRSEPIIVKQVNETEEIHKVLASFKAVQFSYNPRTGTLFLTGHVLTSLDHSELAYLIRTIPFITSIENNVIIDEGVWDSMNGLLAKNPNWRSVIISSPEAGRFVLRGYLPTEEAAANLKTYIDLNFPYLNLLSNQVVVTDTLQAQIQALLIEKGFVNVGFQLNNGEVVFAGRVNDAEEKAFMNLLKMMQTIPGVQQIKNFVIFTGESTARIDLTSQYQVTGTSRVGDVNLYVLINGRILSQGDTLDGMLITAIMDNSVELEKNGIKYKIDYNHS